MRIKVILVLWFLIIVLAKFSLAKNVSLISYGIEEGEVFVRWKSVDTNSSFSIYRSPVLVSNITSFSNNFGVIRKLGVFSAGDLKYKDGYFYFYDKTPEVGTNFYIVFLVKEGKEILEFEPEQNYSEMFLVFIPLPRVSVSFDKEVNTTIVTWSAVSNVDGYLIYKLPLGFNGDLSSQIPLISLPSNQTIFFDVIPRDNSFFYAVIPFAKGITNYYFSSKYNSIVLQGGEKGGLPDYRDTLFHYSLRDNKITTGYGGVVTNVITTYITNFVVFTNTNIIYVTNRIVESYVGEKFRGEVSGRPEVVKEKYPAEGERFVLSNDSVEKKFKEIVSKFFSKKKYSVAREMFKNLLEEISDGEELKGRIMVYIARCEYSLGNRDEAIKLLFKARNLVPDEADFWLNRFLVNR